MQVHFTFRNVESSEGIKNYAREKIGRMQKYLRSPLEADVILSVEKFRHTAEVTIVASGETLIGEEQSDDMYKSIDMMLDKLDRQVRRHKGKLSDHHATETIRRDVP